MRRRVEERLVAMKMHAGGFTLHTTLLLSRSDAANSPSNATHRRAAQPKQTCQTTRTGRGGESRAEEREDWLPCNAAGTQGGVTQTWSLPSLACAVGSIPTAHALVVASARALRPMEPPLPNVHPRAHVAKEHLA